MGKRILVALGGNAILEKEPSAEAQQRIVRETVRELVKLVKAGHELIVCHGNGPQVGNLLLQQEAANSEKNPAMPLDTAVAMTQGSIGYWLQQAFENELRLQGIEKPVATILTQVLVDPDDPAFAAPSKPIGPFYSEAEAQQLSAAGVAMMEDGGRGYRKVVPSPKPIDIVEKDAIRQLVSAGVITISSGGGGVAVYYRNNQLEGVEAVIDKDFASERLAEILDIDIFLILTGVNHVYINYNQPSQKRLEKVSLQELQGYVAQEQFAKGSMLPKVEAAIQFVSQKKKQAIITSIDNVENIFQEECCGTLIVH